MKNEYFQNDVIDLRILGDIGSVCIYRFPRQTTIKSVYIFYFLYLSNLLIKFPVINAGG